MRLQPVAARGLASSRGAGFFHDGVTCAGHRGQDGTRPKLPGNVVGRQPGGYGGFVAALALAPHNHPLRPVNRGRLNLSAPRIAKLHIGHRRTPAAAHPQRTNFARAGRLAYLFAVELHAAFKVRMAQFAPRSEFKLNAGRNATQFSRLSHIAGRRIHGDPALEMTVPRLAALIEVH